MHARPAPRLPALCASGMLALGLVLACAGTPEDEGESPPEGLAAAPVWLLQGCEAHWGDAAGRHLCGVGSAVGPANPSLMRSTAVGRGRTQIARQLHARLQALLEELAAAHGEARRDWDVVGVSKQISDASLAGTGLVETWMSPHGTFYALVALDVATFSETLGGMGTLPEPLRRAVLERADRLFAARGGAAETAAGTR